MTNRATILQSFALLIGMAGVSSADTLPLPGANANIMIGSTSQAGIVPETFVVTPGTSASGSFTAANSSGSASADLTTGILRVSTTGTSTPSMNVSGFEFLEFSGSGTVTYSMVMDGTLSNAATDGDASISGAVDFFNVTGQSPNYFTVQSSGNEYVTNGYLPSASGSRTEVLYGSSYPSYDLPINFQNNIVTTVQNNSGSAVPVSLDVTGSLNVVAGDIYAINIYLTAGDDQIGQSALQSVSFSNTAAFSFTSLGGLTYTSSSGQFLADVPAVVPEPATPALFGLGLLCLGLLAARNKRVSGAR